VLRSKAIALLVVAASLAAICPKAEAQSNSENEATARLLYDEARNLLKEEKYAEACRKLEDSNRLSPATDTKFWLADCYEHMGRIAKAWQLFRNVVDESKAQGNQKKADFARERVQALVPRLAKIKVSVPAEAAVKGLEIKRNGVPVEDILWEQDVPVDPGEYVITAVAPGKKSWEQQKKVGEGDQVIVTIPALQDLQAPPQVSSPPGQGPKPGPKPANEPEGVNWGLRGGAIGVGVLGIGGVVVGTIFGLGAQSQWNNAQEKCGRNLDDCNEKSLARAYSTDADKQATISTVGFAVGGAALAAGVVLWIVSQPRAPAASSSSLQVAPSVGPDHAWMSVRGRF